MRSKQRTAIEKQWHSDVAEFASNGSFMVSIYGGHCSNPREFQLDHILGAQAKRKVNLVSEKVGEFAVIPVPIELHDITSNHPLNVTTNKKKFESVIGNRLDIWLRMVFLMESSGYTIPFDKHVKEAIYG